MLTFWSKNHWSVNHQILVLLPYSTLSRRICYFRPKKCKDLLNALFWTVFLSTLCELDTNPDSSIAYKCKGTKLFWCLKSHNSHRWAWVFVCFCTVRKLWHYTVKVNILSILTEVRPKMHLINSRYPSWISKIFECQIKIYD